jgi:hypothetical protein
MLPRLASPCQSKKGKKQNNTKKQNRDANASAWYRKKTDRRQKDKTFPPRIPNKVNKVKKQACRPRETRDKTTTTTTKRFATIVFLAGNVSFRRMQAWRKKLILRRRLLFV